jgi:hypothetical protein
MAVSNVRFGSFSSRKIGTMRRSSSEGRTLDTEPDVDVEIDSGEENRMEEKR